MRVLMVLALMAVAVGTAAKPGDPKAAGTAKTDAKTTKSGTDTKAGAERETGSNTQDTEGDAAEHDAAPDEREVPHIVGPKLVDLGHNTEIDVPAGMWLVERAEVVKLLAKGGNDTRNAVALIHDPDAEWEIVIEYADVGYVNDDDADELDGAELLESYKQATIQQNAKRRALGAPELIIDNWSERPRYERDTRRLVWGIAAHSSDNRQVVNFLTRILGRNGFLSMNLIDAPERIAASKTRALAVLAATRFRSGYRHEDHQSSDRDSGMGLTGLVLGGTGIAYAAKTGFLIKLLLILKKGIIVIVAAIAGFFRWLFRRRKRAQREVTTAAAIPTASDPPAAPSPPPPDPEPPASHDST